MRTPCMSSVRSAVAELVVGLPFMNRGTAAWPRSPLSLPLGSSPVIDSPPGGSSGALTFAAVRTAITEQLSEVMPDEAYVFLLEGSVPVAPSQRSKCVVFSA